MPASLFALWRRFLDLPNDSPRKAFGVTLLVAFVSALVVSSTSVLLRPAQQVHIDRERQARMDAMLDTLPAMRALMLEAGIDGMETRIVDLAAGRFDPSVEAVTYDPVAAAEDPATSIALSPDSDTAGLKRRANHAPIYLLQRDRDLHLIVLPISGTGYQSTIRAYLALHPDLNTVAALTIFEQGETPGFGARIEEPAWQALWPGKEIADETGAIRISVVQGAASPPYEVDGISGATRTSNGISNMLTFWLGDLGFGPFLKRLKEEGL